MKKCILKFVLFAILAVTASAYSQVEFKGLKKDYTQSMDSLLTYVNKDRVTTGILYDRVMSFANLNALKEDKTISTSNYKHFIQSWSELNRASFNPTFMKVEELKANIQKLVAEKNNLVPIGIINTTMNYIDYGLPERPSLTFDKENGYFHNVEGINPFLERQVTVIAPLRTRIDTAVVKFVIPSNLMLQDRGLKIKNLEASFGTDSKYVFISNGKLLSETPEIRFDSDGLKTFIFRITYENDTTEELQARMYVQVSADKNPVNVNGDMGFPAEENFANQSGENQGITVNSIENNIFFQGYNETVATKGTLEYRTYYNTVTNLGYNKETNTFSEQPKIRKEIMILDGYDPGDGRKIYTGSVGYDPDKKSLYQLMIYSVINEDPVNLVDKLRAAPYGFDVTLVNFPIGADYIERNAMALVALLKRENSKLAANGSNEQISIIGPSMGGLVSRYALAYMEKNSIPHNTKLWVSFDSPHLGANIPISAQENIYFYGFNYGNEDAKVKFSENFFSPVARQLLIEQLDNKQELHPNMVNPGLFSVNNGFPLGVNNGTAFRQQFTANLNSNGFPQNLRKIAVINGTSTGLKTNVEGQKYLELASFVKIKWGQIFGTEFITRIKAMAFEDRYLNTPSNISRTFKGYGFAFDTTPVVEASVYRTNINPRGSMDVVQGGYYPIADVLQTQFDLALDENPIVNQRDWRVNLHKSAFIPSVSALAFKNSDFDWTAPFLRNLICDPLNKEIPFDSYFVAAENEEHVNVTAANAKWLINELEGIPQAPYFPVQTNALQADNGLCEGKNATYTFDDICDVPSPVKYNDQNGNPVDGWSVQGNLQIISSTPYSVTVKGTSNYASTGTITATFQNGQAITKSIHIGVPSFPAVGEITGPSNVTFGQTVSYTYTGAASGYTWQISAPYNDNGGNTGAWQIISGQNTSTITVIAGSITGSATIIISKSNSCGTAIKYTYTMNNNPNTVGGGDPNDPDPCDPTLSVYPNPVANNSNLNLELLRPILTPCGDPNVKMAKDAIVINQVKIYNFYGFLVYSNNTNKDVLKLDNLNLTTGNYTLNVFTSDGKILREVLVVQ